MKKAWAVVTIIVLSGIVAACSKDSNNNDNNNCAGNSYDCAYYGSDYVGGGTGYGYVGAGKWTGSVMVAYSTGFQQMMLGMQPQQCFAYPCNTSVAVVDYAKLRIELLDGDLPSSTRVGFKTFSNGWGGSATQWLSGTAFANANGFTVVHQFGVNGQWNAQWNGVQNTRDAINKIEFVARFRDESRNVLFVTVYYNRRIVARGELRGRSQYDGENDGGYYRKKRITRKHRIVKDDDVAELPPK